MSMHRDISALLTLKKQTHEKHKRTIYRYESTDWDQINRDIENTEWEDIFTEISG